MTEQKENFDLENIDKVKMGKYIAFLRIQKGVTQKEMSLRLNVSDKTVSKWETGMGYPDISMLIPLADYLDTTVESLLKGHDVDFQKMSPREKLMFSRMAFGTKHIPRNTRGRPLYFICAVFAVVSCIYMGKTGMYVPGAIVLPILGTVFGLWAFMWARVGLPEIYDLYNIGFYYDGFLKITMPGMNFNNKNWSYVTKIVRIWSVFNMCVYPIISFGLYSLFENRVISYSVMFAGQMGTAMVTVIGLFIGIYAQKNKTAPSEQ